MAFATQPIDFLDQVPEHRKIKELLLKKYAVKENDIEHPMWDVMMSDYVSQVYSLMHL